MPKQTPRYIREDILDCLENLSVRLAAYEQTTHGRISPDTIECLVSDLAAAWSDQTPYSISNLSQAIEAFLRANRAKNR